jgi:hypothetical protein
MSIRVEGIASMSSESIRTLSLIAGIASKALKREREQRCETDITAGDVRSVLLLHLTIIKRLARSALPEEELAALPPDETPELVRRLAQEIREAADERQRKRSVVH